MMTSLPSRILSSVLLPLLLAACGAGTGTTTTADGGIGGTGITSGPITGFGSVFVNGVEYDTSATEIFINGMPAKEAELGVGMVVRVEGSIDRVDYIGGKPRLVSQRDSKKHLRIFFGTATRIDYNSTLEGPAEIDPVTGTITILGQEVIADNLTVFAGNGVTGLPSLKSTDFLEVSGSPDDLGRIHASRIKKKGTFQGNQEVEVEGKAINVTATTFKIGDKLTVDYSHPSILEEGVAEGVAVEVKGTLDGPGRLSARVVEVKNPGLEVGQGTKVRLEGIVTSALSPNRSIRKFTIDNSQKVSTKFDTTYEYGSAQDITRDQRVMVEGTINGKGVLNASDITFLDNSTGRTGSGEIEIEAHLNGIDPDKRTVNVLGIDIQLINTTRIEDEEHQPIRGFSLQQLKKGDRVEINVFKDLKGSDIFAERLELTDPDQSSLLEGPATVDSANQTLEIIGVGVDITTASFKAGSAAQFFAKVKTGDTVKVTGTFVTDTFFGPGNFQADEVEIED